MEFRNGGVQAILRVSRAKSDSSPNMSAKGQNCMDRRERDRRVQQTRKAILQSFNAMVLKRPYERIHIADIIDGAGIGRSTFYEHFRNKDALFRNSVSAVLTALADGATRAGDAGQIEWVLRHFLEERSSARRLLGGSAGEQVARRLAELIEARMTTCTETVRPALMVPVSFAAAQAAESQLALSRAWLDRPERCEPAILATAILLSTEGVLNSLRANRA